MFADYVIDFFISLLEPLFVWLATIFPDFADIVLGGITAFLPVPGYYIDVLPWLILLGAFFAVFVFSTIFKLVVFIWRLLPLT